MKKSIIVIFTLLLCTLCFACGKTERFEITYTALDGGIITGEKYQSIEKGSDATEVTAMPNTGYVFSHWSDGKTEPSRQDKNIQKNLTLTAAFVKTEDSIELTVIYKAGTGGYIDKGDGQKLPQNEQLIPYGANAATITAIANNGYEFARWSDGKDTAARTDENITYEFTVTAIFVKTEEPIYVQVKYIAGTGGKIEGVKEQNILYGQNADTVIAKPNLGYEFVKWSDGIDTEERTDENIRYEFTVTAIFRFLFEEGNGSQNNPYLISNYSQLKAIANFSNYSNVYFKLIGDIDMIDIAHTPFFDYTNTAFQNSFNGDNHIISNMTVDVYHQFPSLFGFIGSYGSVKNLNMTDVTIKMPNYVSSSSNALCVGAVAGVSLGVLENINVSGEITADKLDYSGVAIGGIVGQAKVKIENCHTEMTVTLNEVTGSTISVGGLAGIVSKDIISCSSKGTIEIDFTVDKNYRTLGGLVGLYLETSGTQQFNITNCYSETEITCNANAICGGLIADIGSKTKVIITNCHSIADITCIDDAGGLIGSLNADNFIVEDCYAIVNIITGHLAGGFIYRISSQNGTIINCYAVGYVEGYYAAGFAEELHAKKENNIEVTNCYAVVDTKGSSDAAGFALYCINTSFYRCYATGRTEGRFYAAGFVYDSTRSIGSISRGWVEECFSTSDVISECNAYGFMSFADYSNVVNCYSTSNIFIINTDAGEHIYATGFIEMPYYTNMTNCYYSGKISGTGIGHYDYISGFSLRMNSGSAIVNCHWVRYSDSIATKAIGEENYDGYEIYEYDNIEQLYLLAATLNANQNQIIWVDVPDSPPQLKFMINKQQSNIP